MVEDLSPADFKALGAYFESRKPQAHTVADPELAQVGRFVFLRGNPYSGVAACAGCHGAKGDGTETLPRLAGQHAQYIENQLQGLQQARAHQRQRGDARHRQQAERAGAEGRGRLHQRPGVAHYNASESAQMFSAQDKA